MEDFPEKVGWYTATYIHAEMHQTTNTTNKRSVTAIFSLRTKTKSSEGKREGNFKKPFLLSFPENISPDFIFATRSICTKFFMFFSPLSSGFHHVKEAIIEEKIKTGPLPFSSVLSPFNNFSPSLGALFISNKTSHEYLLNYPPLHQPITSKNSFVKLQIHHTARLSPCTA